MRGNVMLTFDCYCARRYAGATAALACLIMMMFAGQVSAQVPHKQERQADILEKMTRVEFGPLSPAEVKLVRGAPGRDTQWIGPSQDPDDPTNDPSKTDQWGADRTIRADVFTWLVSDSDPAPYLHPSGVGIAGAKIAGTLDLSYAQVARPLTIIRSAIPEGVDFRHASIAGLDLRASVTGPVIGDFSEVKGDLVMRFGRYGLASLVRASIGGDFDCSGANFTGSGAAYPVSAQEASIAGDVVFHQDFTTDGMLYFRLAKIGRGLSINHAHFVGASDTGLDAERVVVAGPLYWVAIDHTPHTKLDLENASIASLFDDLSSWPAPGNLNIDGLTYSEFGGDSPADSSGRLRWLNLQPAGYRPQPFVQLAKVMKNNGRTEGEVEVLVAERIAQRHSGGMSFSERMWNLLLQSTIGYGYKPLRALWWITGFVLLGAMLFEWGYRDGVMAPTEAEAFDTFAHSGDAPRHYPHFNAFVYSLENFLPVVDLHIGNYWRPNVHQKIRLDPASGKWDAEPASLAGPLLRWYLWFHIIAGWVLTPLLFAGLSGLIRFE